MLQSVSSVLIVYRCKTLTGSPDPTHANGTNKPCICFVFPRTDMVSVNRFESVRVVDWFRFALLDCFFFHFSRLD